MFGGKKGRILEQELQTAQEKQAQAEQALLGVARKKDVLEEQFARVTVSRAQMDADLSEVVEHVKFVKELADADGGRAERLYRNVIETEEEVKAVQKTQKDIVEKITVQRDKIQEIVENNKHFTTPTKYLTEFSGGLREIQGSIQEQLEKMKEFGKNMSVLSLNAAIEAGRMGEAGQNFIQAAEEVRTFSGQYEQTALEVENQVKQLEERNKELEEQMKHLANLLRENNISMGHLLKESIVCVDDYKKEQTQVNQERLEALKTAADEFRNHHQEIANRQDCILVEMEEIGKEFMEQKDCVDELERICKDVTTSAII